MVYLQYKSPEWVSFKCLMHHRSTAQTLILEVGRGWGWDRMAVALIPQCDGKLLNSNHIRVTWPWDLTAKNFVQLKESERATPTRLVDLRLHFLFCCIMKSSLFPSYPTPNPCPHTYCSSTMVLTGELAVFWMFIDSPVSAIWLHDQSSIRLSCVVLQW